MKSVSVPLNKSHFLSMKCDTHESVSLYTEGHQTLIIEQITMEILVSR